MTVLAASHYVLPKVVAAAVAAVIFAIATAAPWLSQLSRVFASLAKPTAVRKQVAEARRDDGRGAFARRPGGLAAGLLGKDGRLSTSKTVAAAWTLVVLVIFVALLIEWPSDWDGAVRNLEWNYFLLLGGPYAALVLSKAAVTAKVSTGSLQKTVGDGTVRLSDLVSDDSGRTDLFDLQYVAFNVVAIAYVIEAFARATLSGFPSIPTALVLLTGGPAAVYAANKSFTSNPVAIFSVAPSTVAAGGSFVLYGQNFRPGRSDGAPPATESAPAPQTPTPQVLVGGYAGSSDPSTWSDTAIQAQAPSAALSGGDYNRPLDVTVVTAAGSSDMMRAALTLTGAPVLLAVSAKSAVVGSQLTLTGSWDAQLDASSFVLVDTVQADATIVQPGAKLTFNVPELGAASTEAQVKIAVGGVTSNPLPLSVSEA